MQTGWNCCRSQMRSHAKSRLTSESSSRAMEDAIQRAARSRYGSENEIQAEIDPHNRRDQPARLLEVVESVENEATQISSRCQAAQSGGPGRRLHRRALPPVDFRPDCRPERQAGDRAERCAMPSVSASMTNTRTASAKSCTVVVKRIEYGNVIVDLGRGEAMCAAMNACRAKASDR